MDFNVRPRTSFLQRYLAASCVSVLTLPICPAKARLQTSMPRYFLHVKNRLCLVRDPDGEELDDLAAAKEEAAAAARDLMAEGLRGGAPLGLHREMILEDELGVTVASVAFAEALPTEE